MSSAWSKKYGSKNLRYAISSNSVFMIIFLAFMWLYVLNCNTCFSCLDQQSPGREFLLRVSYLEIYNEVYYLNKFECCTIFINFFNACIWSYFIWLLNRVLVWFTLWLYLDWLGPSQKGSCLIILLGMHLHFIYSYTFF